MSNIRRVVIGVFSACAVLCLSVPAQAMSVKLVVGKPAPDFKVITLDGKELTLADFKGQVLILNFWATWCGPCKRELPLLDAYYKAQQKFGLRVLAVTTQDSLPLSQLQPLAAVLTIPMVRRFRGPYSDPEAVPTNYVVDRQGVLRYAKAAAFSLDDLNSLLVPLLKEPVSVSAVAATTNSAP